MRELAINNLITFTMLTFHNAIKCMFINVIMHILIKKAFYSAFNDKIKKKTLIHGLGNTLLCNQEIKTSLNNS